MKKILTIFLAGVLILGVAATLTRCGGGETKPDEKGKVEGVTMEGHVSFLFYDYADTYTSAIRKNMNKQMKTTRLAYQDYNGNNNQTTQTEQAIVTVKKGAKLLVVNMVDSSDKAASEILAIAKKADIPVIFFDREVSDEIINSYDKCAYIGTSKEDAKGMAKAITLMMENVARKKDLLSGTNKYLVDEGVAKVRIPETQ